MDFSNKFAASRFAFISDLHTFHILELSTDDARCPRPSLLAQHLAQQLDEYITVYDKASRKDQRKADAPE